MALTIEFANFRDALANANATKSDLVNILNLELRIARDGSRKAGAGDPWIAPIFGGRLMKNTARELRTTVLAPAGSHLVSAASPGQFPSPVVPGRVAFALACPGRGDGHRDAVSSVYALAGTTALVAAPVKS